MFFMHTLCSLGAVLINVDERFPSYNLISISRKQNYFYILVAHKCNITQWQSHVFLLTLLTLP